MFTFQTRLNGVQGFSQCNDFAKAIQILLRKKREKIAQNWEFYEGNDDLTEGLVCLSKLT
jgi:hypothetical protein